MGDFDTLADLGNRVRDGLADHTDTFFSPNEIRAALNEGMWEIYKILHAENSGFFFSTTPEIFTLSSSTNYYILTNHFAWVDEIRPTSGTERAKKFYYRSRHDQEFRELLNLPVDELFANADTYYYDVVNEKTLVIAPLPVTSFQVSVYPVVDPTELSDPGDEPPMKVLWRPLMVEYAVRKLKNKEETGEYLSHEKLFGFLLENLGKYAKPRGGTNQLIVEEYSP